MKRLLLLIFILGSTLAMEPEEILEPPPERQTQSEPTLNTHNLEALARSEHHHSISFTINEEDVYGPMPASPKTIEHQYAMKKMRWGLVIAIVGGVGGILAAFLGAFFGRPCPA